MKPLTIFFAAMTLTSTMFAQDAGYGERFRMKYGRPPVERAAEQEKCSMGCCKRHAKQTAKQAATGDPAAAERFKLKMGQASGKAAQPVVVASAEKCGMPCCD
jgi:hypothetical protein